MDNALILTVLFGIAFVVFVIAGLLVHWYDAHQRRKYRKKHSEYRI